MMSKEIFSEQLKKSGELEGGLFAEIYLRYSFGQYIAKRDLYTVKDGEVYYINADNTLAKANDSLWDLKRSCHRVGTYNPKTKYKPLACTLSYADVKAALKIK